MDIRVARDFSPDDEERLVYDLARAMESIHPGRVVEVTVDTAPNPVIVGR